MIVCGATASGKTDFAVRMAKRLHSEVISADCMLIYKGMNIGTAKPTAAEMDGVPHHMIDIVDPLAEFSAGDYETAARPCCERLLQEGKSPVLCGGTGFYLQSLVFKRSLGNAGSSREIRAKYDAVLEEEGKDALFSLLAEIDPQSAEKLHPNDTKRVIRALEIYELTGKKKSEQCDGFIARYPYVAVAFDYPRDELYARIEHRADKMLDAGLVEEVRGLLNAGVGETSQSMQGIGYKEVAQYIKGDILYSTMRDIIKQNTRNYAKRQITFFKKFPGLVWLDPRSENNEEKVMELLSEE